MYGESADKTPNFLFGQKVKVLGPSKTAIFKKYTFIKG